MSPLPNPPSNPQGTPRGTGPRTPPSRPVTVPPVGATPGRGIPGRPSPARGVPAKPAQPQSGARPAMKQPTGIRKAATPGGPQKAPPAGATASRRPMPPEVAAASKSAHLGGFVKIQKVGSGAMGEVFKAWDLKEGRWVALKILRSNDMTQLARFVREAQVASGMDHRNITKIYDAGKDKGLWFIAMQFIAGHTLRAFPRTNRRISVELMRDAARALQYAHDKGTVHRDLKPENFMVQSKPKPGANSKSIDGCTHQIFVMDFGIARPSDASTQLTIPGTVMGSPSFMSPEQASGREVDHRTDVYALGATLYDRLCGKPPFESKNIFEGLRLVQETMPPRPSSIDPSIDPKLEKIVMKTLEKDPAKRPQSAEELAQALDAWLQENKPAEEAPAGAKKGGCGKAAVWMLAAGAAGAALMNWMA